mgnify:FL=1
MGEESNLLCLMLGSLLKGSEHNDEFFIDEAGNVRTRTNRSGGIQVTLCICIMILFLILYFSF